MKNKLFLIFMIFMIVGAYTVPFLATADDVYLSEGLTIRHYFENNTIAVDTFYKTDYQSGYWRITDNKNLEMILSVVDQPENMTILVEHMHADCLIFANQSQEINGITQDSMDDSFHGDQGGFYVSMAYQYNNVFAIEGYSQFLMSTWGFICGDYGYIRGQDRRLTETNLVAYGAEGSEFMIVFDILIQNASETLYHTISFMDDFVVFFNGAFIENLGGVLEPPELATDKDIIIYIVIGAVGAAIIVGIIYAITRNNY